MSYVGTFVISFWILADILQDLHDVHERLEDLKKPHEQDHI